jgi:hypothetical protein
MRINQALYLGVAAGALALTVMTPSDLRAQQGAAVNVDGDDIGGVVTSPKGPEAGVRVIAETVDLPTRLCHVGWACGWRPVSDSVHDDQNQL